MIRDFWEIFRYGVKKVVTSRITPLLLIFGVMFGLLVLKLFELQVLQGADYQEEYLENTRREIYTPATRGNIYDRNGVPLAYNELTYAVTVTDTGDYPTGYEKNKMLLRLLRLLSNYEATLVSDIPLALQRDGSVVFTTSSEPRHRSFLRDFYRLSSADELDTYDEDGTLINRSNITAEEVYEEYISRYGIGQNSRNEKDGTYEFTKEEGLQLINLRYAMASSAFRQYEAVTLATGLGTEAMMAVEERAAELRGVHIEERTLRIYNDAYEFAHILGYTGKASNEDLETLQAMAEEAGVARERSYALGDVVGKAGIEEYMELELAGTKGYSEIYVDNVGRIVETASSTDSIAGNDVYLSIDRDLQVGIYHLAEQMVAGILVDRISTIEPDDPSMSLKDETPIKMVYYQLIGNNILSMADFYREDASEVERAIYAKMESERSMVMSEIRYELTRDDPRSYNDMDENNQIYMSYIMTLLREGGYVLPDQVDTSDELYKAWSEGNISLKEYLYHAISMNWIDTSKLEMPERYPTAERIYDTMLDKVMEILETNSDFCKKIYQILIYNGTISGQELCLSLFEQGVLEQNEEDMAKLREGGAGTAYSFLIDKIKRLEITPGELALMPCACSVILTDLDTGEVLAMVSYPSYDINRLSGTVEAAYYSQLREDAATPLYNTATQVLRAPGSVFKMITAAAGLEEGVISEAELINDTGTYSQFDNQFQLRCWNTRGHGPLNVVGALGWSCNYFFCETGYRLSLDENGNYSSAVGLSRLKKYADLFGFNSTSGIEIYESEPSFSNENPIPSAIGQGSHAFANVHLARYLAAIATKGKMFRLTLLDRLTDSTGNVIRRHEPEVEYEIDFEERTWELLWDGMYSVVTNGGVADPFRECAVSLAGKTGTAQEATNRPNHARFVGFAPYEDPEIGITITIPNGYTGTNAAILANDVLNFYFGKTSLETILNDSVAIESYGGGAND
ncbi:MAG: penicillin-binding protein [Lachnospiraceae bacterium]|nr:penicillin-binding protein [Lachnospiraceae bacterium]